MITFTKIKVIIINYIKDSNSFISYTITINIRKNIYNEGKHFNIAKRMIDKGGRRDICLGARECQAYVEPGRFGEGEGFHDNSGEIAYGLTFHGFDYPDETGINELHTRFWHPKMVDGIINFPRPESSNLIRKFVREMIPNPPKSVGLNEKGIEL